MSEGGTPTRSPRGFDELDELHIGTPEGSIREKLDAASARTKRVLNQVKQRSRIGRVVSAPGGLASMGAGGSGDGGSGASPLARAFSSAAQPPPGSPSRRPRRQEGGFSGRSSDGAVTSSISLPTSPGRGRSASPLAAQAAVKDGSPPLMALPPSALPILPALNLERDVVNRSQSHTRERWVVSDATVAEAEAEAAANAGSEFNRVIIDREMFTASPAISEVSVKLMEALRLREIYQRRMGYESGSGEATIPDAALAPVASESESEHGERLRLERGVFDLPRWRRQPAFVPHVLPVLSPSESAREFRLEQVGGIFYVFERASSHAAVDADTDASASSATADAGADAVGGIRPASSRMAAFDGDAAASAAAAEVVDVGGTGSAESAPAARTGEVLMHAPVSVATYYTHFTELMRLLHDGETRSMTYRRLKLLEARFDLHTMLNASAENEVQRAVPHRDFYNCRKVDTHVHHSACMNQKKLLRFIKKKLRTCPEELVCKRDGKLLTLLEVFASLEMTPYDLSIDTLDMHADNTFHRFDRFNLKYNPAGQSRLREIFLKHSNVIGGRYLAECSREVFDDLEAHKYSLAEYRISVYGRNRGEWHKLAAWWKNHSLQSPNVRWLIQVPRIYSVWRSTGMVNSFAEMIDNIFGPLFEATLNPLSDLNADLTLFLNSVVGFDSVDDESRPERVMAQSGDDIIAPENWTSVDNPPYSYWVYYLYANIATLNNLRKSRGLSTFSFRPHAGEAGDLNHLASVFLLATGINHGIQLRKSPVLQYLFYVAQIGIAMSPLSNNKLFLDFTRNPFHSFFKRGLNVSLSTDDPLMLHYTKEPLVEEYAVATQLWKLTSTDMCEIARNSVLQSGWEPRFKRHFIGETYLQSGPRGNDIHLTNVPGIRMHYRDEALRAETAFMMRCAAAAASSRMPQTP